MAQAPSVANFTGSWTLEKSENLDDYLKIAENIGWLTRKAAAAFPEYSNILHDPDKGHLKIHINVVGKGQFCVEGPTDGSDFDYVDFDKNTCRAQFTVKDDGTVVESFTRTNKKEGATRFIERSVGSDGKLTVRLVYEKGDISTHMIRLFKKTGEEPTFPKS